MRWLPCLGLFACAGGDTDALVPLADSYALPDSLDHPESLAFDPATRAFYVGSLGHGAVSRIDADGTVTELYRPEAGFMSLGVEVAPDGRVAVCAISGVGTEQVYAELWLLGTEPGALATIALGAGSNCNDLAFDGDFAYVTDRESAVVHRASLSALTAEPWLEDDVLAPEFIGQNGVVVTPDRHLLLAKYSPPRLFRAPLDAPSELAEVEITGDLPGLPDGFDGMILYGDALVIAANATVVSLRSTDGWASATATSAAPEAAIAGVAEAEGVVYGLKGEVVPWVLGLEDSLPYEVFTFTPP